MAHSNTFILLILWMIIVMIGTSNTGKKIFLYKKGYFILFQDYMRIKWHFVCISRGVGHSGD